MNSAIVPIVTSRRIDQAKCHNALPAVEVAKEIANENYGSLAMGKSFVLQREVPQLEAFGNFVLSPFPFSVGNMRKKRS